MKTLAYVLNADITCVDHLSDDLAEHAESGDSADISTCTADDLNPVEFCSELHSFCGRCGETELKRTGFFYSCPNCTMVTFAPDNDDQTVVDDVRRLTVPTGKDFESHEIIIGSVWGPERMSFAYQLVTGTGHDRPVFYGTDLGAPRGTDVEDAVMTLLNFLTLRPGDTDAEYFENYSAAQHAWMDEHAEQLSCLPYDYSVAQEEDATELDAFGAVTLAYGADWTDWPV